MKHRKMFLFLSVFLILFVYAGCTDTSFYRSDLSEDIPDGPLKEMKDCFEEHAPMLHQVNFDDASVGNTRNSLLSGNVNLVPAWSKARLWEGERLSYAEIPLSGKGIHKVAFLSSKKEFRVYPVRSYLLLTRDKSTGSIRYTVVTTITQAKRYMDKPSERVMQFVGNSNFEGLVIFSGLDGVCYNTLHLHNGKSHPVIIGSKHAFTRSLPVSSDELSPFGISLVSASSGYEDGELDADGNFVCGVCHKKYAPTVSLSCPDCNNVPGNCIYCSLCGRPYDMDKGDCPNGCVVEIPGSSGGGGGNVGGGTGVIFVECPICRRLYDSSLGSCPMGCESTCPVCHKNPCECYHYACERCGSSSCPGPWSCGGTESCGVQCLVCGGYKNAAHNGASCPPCTCDDYSVFLGVIPSVVDLGDDYKWLLRELLLQYLSPK